MSSQSSSSSSWSSSPPPLLPLCTSVRFDYVCYSTVCFNMTNIRIDPSWQSVEHFATGSQVLNRGKALTTISIMCEDKRQRVGTAITSHLIIILHIVAHQCHWKWLYYFRCVCVCVRALKLCNMFSVMCNPYLFLLLAIVSVHHFVSTKC